MTEKTSATRKPGTAPDPGAKVSRDTALYKVVDMPVYLDSKRYLPGDCLHLTKGQAARLSKYLEPVPPEQGGPEKPAALDKPAA